MCFHQSLCSTCNAFFFANFGFYGRPISISDFYGWCGFVNFGFYRVILWGQFLSSPCEAVWPIWGSLCDTLLGLMDDVFPPVLDILFTVCFPPLFLFYWQTIFGQFGVPYVIQLCQFFTSTDDAFSSVFVSCGWSIFADSEVGWWWISADLRFYERCIFVSFCCPIVSNFGFSDIRILKQFKTEHILKESTSARKFIPICVF